MGPDDFIDLDPCSYSDDNGEPSRHNLDSRLSESEYTTSAFKKKEDIPNGDNYEAEERKKDIGNEPTTTVGVKRARVTSADQPPTVRVIYSSLTRESKKRLMELMQQWSEWHAHSQSSSSESLNEPLEYGEETYFPALNVGSENNSTVSFWLDSKSKMEEVREYLVDNDSVPLYDRGCTLGSTLPNGSTGPERSETLEASRCFNCGSYNHSLKECPKPRDNAAINNARQQLNSKRNQAPGSRAPSRYYQKSPGKFDDLKAGVLGLETRESLGIGKLDPPPWLQRMRDMGYPPGYLDVEDEDQPSGIMIFGDEEKVEHEDGELPEKGDPEPQEKKMTVEFPGINAPVPKNADQRRWAVTPCAQSGSNSSANRSNPRSKPPSLDSPRMPYHDQRRPADHRNEGTPGADYGTTASIPVNSPRYSPYDLSAVSGSPRLGRSLSDRGWRSPLPYATSPGLSPHSPSYPYARSPGLSPHSPYYSTLQRESPRYHGPTAGPEQWRHESPYNASPDISSQPPRDWYDHRLQRR